MQKSNQAPEYLAVLFNRVSVMTDRTICNANINPRSPRSKTTLGKNCFAHRRALLWNKFSTEIKSAKSYDSFKNEFKKQQQIYQSNYISFNIYLYLLFHSICC